VLLLGGSAEADAAAADKEGEEDEEEEAAKDQNPEGLQTACPCWSHLCIIPVCIHHNRLIKIIRWRTPLLCVLSVGGVSVLVEAALHLPAQLVLPVAEQWFGEQGLPYSVQELLHEDWVHIGLTCLICALLLRCHLNSLPIACPKNQRQGKGKGAKYCKERGHFLFFSLCFSVQSG